MTEENAKTHSSEKSQTISENKINSLFDNSNISKQMPRSIPKLSIHEIIKTIFAMKILYLAPFYLIMNWGMEIKIEFLQAIYGFFKKLGIYIMLGDALVGGVMYFLRLKMAVLIVAISMILKASAFLIVTLPLLFTKISFGDILFYLIFVASFAAIDFAYGLYLYYIIRNNIQDESIPEVDIKHEGEKV